MSNEYRFSPPDPTREQDHRISVVNICAINGVDQGIPVGERGQDIMEMGKTSALYTDALQQGIADPVLVGIPHAGEYAPKDVVDRIVRPYAFVDGLDAGTAHIYSPREGEKYIAVRNKVSRLIADPNRGPRQFASGLGVGGVTWTTDLQEHPIYADGQEPTQEEMAHNVDAYYTPYYRGLHALIASLHEKMEYQQILFLDAHSFPGTTDVPKIGLVAGEAKPLFIVGCRGNVKSSAEVTELLTSALKRFAPDKDAFPEIYTHISDVVREDAQFGWGGARNVDYFGFPDGVNQTVHAPKIHAIQLETNMSAFFSDGKYHQASLNAMRETIQKTVAFVGKKLREMQ